MFLQAKHAEYSVNLAPHPRAVTRAFRDLILAYGWRSVLCYALPPALICVYVLFLRMFTILYEESEALIRLQV